MTEIPAITIYQPWATLIAIGAEPFEFRRWAAPAWVRGRRIAVHAGARKVQKTEVKELIYNLTTHKGFGTGLKVDLALPLLEKLMNEPELVPRSSVVALATMGVPRKASSIFAGDGDSSRIDHHVWAWPMDNVAPLEPVEPAAGAQGWWMWKTSRDLGALPGADA